MRRRIQRRPRQTGTGSTEAKNRTHNCLLMARGRKTSQWSGPHAVLTKKFNLSKSAYLYPVGVFLSHVSLVAAARARRGVTSRSAARRTIVFFPSIVALPPRRETERRAASPADRAPCSLAFRLSLRLGLV